MSKVFVIGGGAAGMMAAIAAALNGNEVHIFEKNEKFGKKLYITGKGRCNLTNACEVEELFSHVCRNEKFLYSAFYGFSNEMVMDFFEDAGCRLKIEHGKRVFPVSDHASDVIAALVGKMERAGVLMHLCCEVESLLYQTDENGMQAGDAKKPRVIGVWLKDQTKLYCDAVIVTTGGLSYPSTGSTGDGYRFALDVGHKVTDLSPSLVPLEAAENYVKEMQGLSLRNVEVGIFQGNREIYRGFGEMLFTHFGVSGPLILAGSSYVAEAFLREEKKRNKTNNSSQGGTTKKHRNSLSMKINLKPALSEQQLEQRILREFEKAQNKQFKNVLCNLLPAKMVPAVILLSGISGDKKINGITRVERQQLIWVLRDFPLTITGMRDYREAVITKGGVSVKEIDPSTMESKICKNLYFAGEVLDLDAVTGGFNLQIAWSTGCLAGRSV